MLSDARPQRLALLVFADDWGRHPSSCQHLIGRLLGEFDVTWVNTIGTRTPRLNLATVRRGLEKVGQWTRPRREQITVPSGLKILNPRMWPWFTSPRDRWLNLQLLRRQLKATLEHLPEPPVAITTLPIVADLIGALPVSKWVYYCVDDFSLWPGLDQATLAAMETQVIAQSDVLIAVSSILQEKLRLQGRDSHLLTHGVDHDFWCGPDPCRAPTILNTLEAPFIIFWGVVDRRMDLAMVQSLSQAMQRGTIVLAGPHNEPDPALLQLPRVRAVGPLPYADLPSLAGAADVLIMPYADLPVTRAMQPLKLKEYLATGKPTVARDLPANRDWADALDLVDGPESFARVVVDRLRSDLPASQRIARRRLAEESWENKAKQFAALLTPPETRSKGKRAAHVELVER